MGGTEMDEDAKRRFCATKPVTFTAVRNPWSRIVAAYIGKIAS